MGSAIGAIASYSQYKSSSKALKKMEAKMDEQEAETKALTPATARNADDGDSDAKMAKKRKGVQATFTASKPSGGTVGE